MDSETTVRVTLHGAADFLESAMLSPMKNACITGMGVAADRIDEALDSCTTLDAKIGFTTTYTMLIRAAMEFLAGDRPEIEFVMMISQLLECTCDVSEAEVWDLHQLPIRHRPDISVPLNAPPPGTSTQELLQYIVIKCITRCITLSLSNLTYESPSSDDLDNADAADYDDDYEGLWPQNYEDVFPDGLTRAVGALQQWNSQNTGGSIFVLASELATYFGPFARAIFTSSDTTFIIDQPIEHLQKAIDAYEKSIVGDLPENMGVYLFDNPVKAIIGFWDTLEHIDPALFETMFYAYAEELYPVLSMLHELFPPELSTRRTIHRYLAKVIVTRNSNLAITRATSENHVERVGEAVADSGGKPIDDKNGDGQRGQEADAAKAVSPTTDVSKETVHGDIEAPQTTTTQDTSKPEEEKTDDSQLESTPVPIALIKDDDEEIQAAALQEAYTQMSRARKSGCWNINCPHFESIIRTQLCGGCLLLRYCSPDCQKDAWKSGQSPHAPLCATIQKFMMSVGREGWEALGTPEYTFDAFHRMFVGKNLDVQVLKEIETAITTITRDKNLKIEQDEVGKARMRLPDSIKLYDHLYTAREISPPMEDSGREGTAPKDGMGALMAVMFASAQRYRDSAKYKPDLH